MPTKSQLQQAIDELKARLDVERAGVRDRMQKIAGLEEALANLYALKGRGKPEREAEATPRTRKPRAVAPVEQAG